MKKRFMNFREEFRPTLIRSGNREVKSLQSVTGLTQQSLSLTISDNQYICNQYYTMK